MTIKFINPNGPMPEEQKKKLAKVRQELNSDYVKGYNKAFNKAYNWLASNLLHVMYIGYDVSGEPYIDSKMLCKHFKKAMKL